MEDIPKRTPSQGSQGRVDSPHPNRKAAPCVHWLRGNCSNGQCGFKHDEAAKGSQPNAPMPKAKARGRSREKKT